MQNFVIDLAHLRVSVAQWKNIVAQNLRVWGSIPGGDSEVYLCHTLVTRPENIFLYFFTELKNLPFLLIYLQTTEGVAI